jgi:broad specificity phosphatase PhoE
MRLYIIRHGQSTNNALANLRDRVCDPDLTDLGRRQVELVAEHLVTGIDPAYFEGVSEEDTAADSRQGYRLTRLYCSAMYRALLTTRPIARALGLKPEVWVDIHEHGGIYLDHGGQQGIKGYPGKTRSEILEEFPDYSLPEEVTDHGWWNPERGLEDWPTCQGRAIKVAATLREWSASDEHIAIVSHGGFIDVLIKALTSQLPNRHLFFHHYNTAITRIDFRADGTLDFRYINRFDHLPARLIS